MLTHTDLIVAEKPSQYIETYIKNVRDTVEGKPYVAYITKENIFLVDNKTGPNHRFNDVRRELFDSIIKQPTTGMERPLRWLKLEADVLEKANYEGQPYLHISKVNELASALVMDDHEVESFLKFHHVLGNLVYYKEPKLKDFIITNPQWLLDMFKTLITPHEFFKRRQLQPDILQQLKKGTVSEKTLQVLWKGNDIQFLTNLMIKFDLILPLDSAN